MSENAYAQLKKWPYPVNYGKENEILADILIIGGGIAGCHAIGMKNPPPPVTRPPLG